jgi:SAM-dependent methyltransferase
MGTRPRARKKVQERRETAKAEAVVLGQVAPKASAAAPAAAPSADALHFQEVQLSFQSLESWNMWAEAHKEIRDTVYINEMARSIHLTGFLDPLSGFVHPSEIVSADSNHREGFEAYGVNSRYRAMMLPLVEHTLMNGQCCTIYLSEHITGFANFITRRFPYAITSEYISSPAARRRMFQIRHEDPLRLTFPDHAFDLYLSSDRIIYAHSLMDYLKEARRVLRRTGQLIATFPFRYGEQSTEVRAHNKNGEITHLLPPKYHDDPLDSGTKRLIFFIPGWDILDAARDAGFSSAEIIAINSRKHAVLGTEIATVFVLRATA